MRARFGLAVRVLVLTLSACAGEGGTNVPVSPPFDELEIRDNSATLRVRTDRAFLDVVDVSAFGGALASEQPLWDLVQTLPMSRSASDGRRKSWVMKLANGTATVSQINVESGGKVVEKWELRFSPTEPLPLPAFGGELAAVEQKIPPETRSLSVWSRLGGLVELDLMNRQVTSAYLAFPGRPDVREPRAGSSE